MFDIALAKGDLDPYPLSEVIFEEIVFSALL